MSVRERTYSEGQVEVSHGEPARHEAPRHLVHLDLTEPEPGSPEQKVAVTAFVVGATVWIVFLATMLLDGARLTEIWNGFRGQALVWQFLEGLLLLPWTLGLAVWSSGWELWLRALAVVATAITTLYLFYPWKGKEV